MTVENKNNNINNENETQKLFRRPKPSKLIQIDVSNVKDPNDTEDIYEEQLSKIDSIEFHNKGTLSLPSITNDYLKRDKMKLPGPSRIQFDIKSARTEDIYNISFQKRSLAQSKLSKSVVKPFKTLGPDPLPMRPVRQQNQANNYHPKLSLYENLLFDDYSDLNYVPKENQFSLNDFLLHKNSKKNYSTEFYNHLSKYDEDQIDEEVEEEDDYNLNVEDNIYISSDNYKKICKILEDRIQKERNINSSNIHIQTLIPEIEPFENRKPLRHTLIEMAYFLKNELSEKTGAKLKTKFNPVSKWQRLNGAQTELVIYEEKSNEKDQPKQVEKQQALPKQSEQEEFQPELKENEEITHAHLAIVDCLLRDGIALSLKAHFIDELPDIASLRKTLIYLNLSFNNFKEIPDDVFKLSNLEVIKLRSNPIKYLPERLANLRNLKVLTLSFCLLTELEPCIFELDNITYLDVSYNKLSEINEKIVKLSKLVTLNVEGNELEYLPSIMLKMKQLKQINLKNNYMHPLLWRKYLQNQVPSLFAECAAKFDNLVGYNSSSLDSLSNDLQDKLKNYTRNCECCDGKIYGSGLKIIRPCVKIFGVKYVPFLFYSCSIECYNSFKKK